MTERETPPPTEDDIIRSLINEHSKIRTFDRDWDHGHLHPDSEQPYKEAIQRFQSSADWALSMITEGTSTKLKLIEDGDYAWIAFPHPRGGFEYKVNVPLPGPRLLRD
jgi:hypothetical protein